MTQLEEIKKIIPGLNYLHTHPGMEHEKAIDKDHVIVDKKDYDQVIYLLRSNPDLMKEIHKRNRAIYGMSNLII